MSTNSSDTLEELRDRGERSKPMIEARSGPAISATEAGKRLKCSAKYIRGRVERDELIGYVGVGGRTRTLLPLWQFKTENSAHEWVPDLIKAYGSNGWGLLSFVTAGRTNLGGNDYLNILQTDPKAVLDAAERANPR